MSTRSTIHYDDKTDAHLYQDGFDMWNVYLSVPAAMCDADQESVLCIPLAVWKEMRQHTLHMERYLDISPEDLLAEATVNVATRIREWREAPENLKGLRAVGGCGSFNFVSVEAPSDKQVEGYIRWHTPPEKREAAQAKMAEGRA